MLLLGACANPALKTCLPPLQMETTAAQATAQSAKTLRIDPNDGSGASDSVTVEEFAQLLLREVKDTTISYLCTAAFSRSLLWTMSLQSH